jgi:hypothetical protein
LTPYLFLGGSIRASLPSLKYIEISADCFLDTICLGDQWEQEITTREEKRDWIVEKIQEQEEDGVQVKFGEHVEHAPVLWDEDFEFEKEWSDSDDD